MYKMFSDCRYLSYLFRKDIGIISAALVLCFVIRILRPFKPIQIVCWRGASRLGHLITELDIHLAKQNSLTQFDNNYCILYYIPGPTTGSYPLIPNKYLYQHASNFLPGIKYSRIISWIVLFNEKFFNIRTEDAFGTNPHVDKCLFSARTTSPFKISKKDAYIAQKKALELGINLKQPTLLFFNRDSSYIKKYISSYNEGINNHRNSSISNFIPMAEFFNTIGYSCLRMGKETEQKIKDSASFLDLSFYHPGETLESYLFSISKFSVSDCTGLNMLASLFRKPRVIVNNIPFLNFIVDGFFYNVFDSILTFKKHWCVNQGRALTFSEIKAKNLLYVCEPDDYVQNNIELINNTPEEILDAAHEMHQRLNGEWEETEEDIILQHRFWKHVGVKRDTRWLSLYPRVGAKFLRENSWLME